MLGGSYIYNSIGDIISQISRPAFGIRRLALCVPSAEVILRPLNRDRSRHSVRVPYEARWLRTPRQLRATNAIALVYSGYCACGAGIHSLPVVSYLSASSDASTLEGDCYRSAASSRASFDYRSWCDIAYGERARLTAG